MLLKDESKLLIFRRLLAGHLLLLFYDLGHLTQKQVHIIFGKGGNLTKGYESFFKEVKKEGGDEENHYVGNGFGDDASISWRMLAMVV
jgi:hypothetical protein